MPTPRCLTLLLATTALLADARAESGDRSTYTPEAFGRLRPGVTSSGPRRAPRVDTKVEPATFRAIGKPKPVNPSGATADEPQPVLLLAEQEPAPAPAETPTTPPDPLRVEAAEPLLSTPAPTAAAPSEETLSSPPADEDPRRRLSFSPADKAKPSEGDALRANPLASLMEWRPTSQTLTATGAGLAIAVGLLLSFVWLVRSCMPKSARQLPREVVEVLGRAPLGGKQTTQLVRVGHKLVLVAVTPEGAEPLTEITDPDEVARLIAACDTSGGRGSTADFDNLLQSMSDERSAPGFLGARDDYPAARDSRGFADGAFDPRSLAAAYANTPGGRGDG